MPKNPKLANIAITLVISIRGVVRVDLIPKIHTILPNLKTNEGWNLIEWYSIHEYMLIYYTFQEISVCSKVFVGW